MKKLVPIVSALLVSPFLLNAQLSSPGSVLSEERIRIKPETDSSSERQEKAKQRAREAARKPVPSNGRERVREIMATQNNEAQDQGPIAIETPDLPEVVPNPVSEKKKPDDKKKQEKEPQSRNPKKDAPQPVAPERKPAPAAPIGDALKKATESATDTATNAEARARAMAEARAKQAREVAKGKGVSKGKGQDDPSSRPVNVPSVPAPNVENPVRPAREAMEKAKGITDGEERARAMAEARAARAKAEAEARAAAKGMAKGRGESIPERPEPSTAPGEPATQPEPPRTRNEEAAAVEREMEKEAEVVRTEVKDEAAEAAEENDEKKAADVVNRILGEPAVAADADVSARTDLNQGRQDRRPAADEVGRTESERSQTVDFLVKRFLGQNVEVVPPAFRDQRPVPADRDRRPGSPDRDRFDDRDRRPDARRGHGHHHHHGRTFDGRRFVRYQNRGEIPAILLASFALNRVNIVNVEEHYHNDPPPNRFPRPLQEIPQSYQAPSAYELSYEVDESSMITQDDILFLQGSTAFADDYSADIVYDLAYAMQDPALRGYNFVVEGHASAEGSYAMNLDLSQRRAERIVREMVRAGVSPQRLIPVGYGENEAYYPADAPESQRRFDRKVVVFRLKQ